MQHTHNRLHYDTVIRTLATCVIDMKLLRIIFQIIKMIFIQKCIQGGPGHA